MTFYEFINYDRSIQKWWVSVQAKAAAISQPQAKWGYAEDCEERERRHGPKDAVYGWARDRSPPGEVEKKVRLGPHLEAIANLAPQVAELKTHPAEYESIQRPSACVCGRKMILLAHDAMMDGKKEPYWLRQLFHVEHELK
jgi:hypothetical protein